MDGHRADTAILFDQVEGAPKRPPETKNVCRDGHVRRITTYLVRALDAPASGNRVVWDSDLTGFGVRITSAGSVSFVLRYVLNGRERRFTIGKYPDLSPSAARERATVLRGRITMGEDPLEGRREAREAPTMADLCDDYLERHARPKKRPKSVEGDERTIRLYIKPKLGNRKVASIGRRDLDELHQSLKDRSYQANRLMALMSKMFSLAVAWGWRQDNPAKGVERFAEHPRHRWLGKDELGALSGALASHRDERVANVIRLLILTGARRGEALSATWDQFDLKRGVWIKPSHHTKQKKTEHVPLSGAALQLVSEMRAAAVESVGGDELLCSAPFLFPGDVDGKPLQVLKRAWTKICKGAGLDGVRIHDLRHTYASHLVSGGHSLPLVGRLLGHTQTATTQRYAHLADDPLRKASDDFGKLFEEAAEERANLSKPQTVAAPESSKTNDKQVCGKVIPFKPKAART